MIGKASRPFPVPGRPGKQRSASLISSTNVKYWLQGGEEHLEGAHGITPATFLPDMNRIESALVNLMLATTNDKTVLEQLTAENRALTGTIAMLTAINKKLADKVFSLPMRSPAHAPPLLS